MKLGEGWSGGSPDVGLNVTEIRILKMQVRQLINHL